MYIVNPFEKCTTYNVQTVKVVHMIHFYSKNSNRLYILPPSLNCYRSMLITLSTIFKTIFTHALKVYCLINNSRAKCFLWCIHHVDKSILIFFIFVNLSYSDRYADQIFFVDKKEECLCWTQLQSFPTWKNVSRKERSSHMSLTYISNNDYNQESEKKAPKTWVFWANYFFMNHE